MHNVYRLNYVMRIKTSLPGIHTRHERIAELESILATNKDELELCTFIKARISDLNNISEEFYIERLKLLDNATFHVITGLDDIALTHLENAVNPKKGKWIVEVKGDGTDGSVEVSAVVNGCHGHFSWGWADPMYKVITLSSNGTQSSCSYVDPRIIETAKSVAQEIVDRKNSGGLR